MSGIEVDGDIGLRRPRPTHGCRADDDGPHSRHGRFGEEIVSPAGVRTMDIHPVAEVAVGLRCIVKSVSDAATSVLSVQRTASVLTRARFVSVLSVNCVA